MLNVKDLKIFASDINYAHMGDASKALKELLDIWDTSSKTARDLKIKRFKNKLKTNRKSITKNKALDKRNLEFLEILYRLNWFFDSK